MNQIGDFAQQPDPDFEWPTITVTTMTVAGMAGLLIGVQEYLEALDRVAMHEHRPRSKHLPNLRLARDVLVQWSMGNPVDPKECTCPQPVGLSRMRGCPVHDPVASEENDCG